MKPQGFGKMGQCFGRCTWLAAFGISFVAGCRPALRPPGKHPVGVTTLLAAQRGSDSPLTVEVWYPAASGTQEKILLYGDLYPGRAARQAAIAPQLPSAPLVVVGHGLKSSRFDMSWLAEALAADGIIVAAVDHPGTSAETWNAVEAVKIWVRATQLSAVIDALLGHAVFGAHIDPNRIAALGHSAGGSAALLLGGAEVNAEQFAQRYPASAPCPVGVGPDPRVRAIIALAPGTGRIFAREGVAKMQHPTLIVSGTRDQETPEKFNAEFYHTYLPHCQWHSLADVGHYTFKPLCNTYGKIRNPGLCLDHWRVSRSTVHESVIQWSRDFLASTLALGGAS